MITKYCGHLVTVPAAKEGNSHPSLLVLHNHATMVNVDRNYFTTIDFEESANVQFSDTSFDSIHDDISTTTKPCTICTIVGYQHDGGDELRRVFALLLERKLHLARLCNFTLLIQNPSTTQNQP